MTRKHGFIVPWLNLSGLLEAKVAGKNGFEYYPSTSSFFLITKYLKLWELRKGEERYWKIDLSWNNYKLHTTDQTFDVYQFTRQEAQKIDF